MLRSKRKAEQPPQIILRLSPSPGFLFSVTADNKRATQDFALPPLTKGPWKADAHGAELQRDCPLRQGAGLTPRGSFLTGPPGTHILSLFKQLPYPHPRGSHISAVDGRKAHLATKVTATGTRPSGSHGSI